MQTIIRCAGYMATKLLKYNENSGFFPCFSRDSSDLTLFKFITNAVGWS